MSETSGAQWCARFPTSKLVTDLAQAFQGDVHNFIQRIVEAKGSVDVAATYRPKERAYLMHWAWEIARNGVDPASVPAMDGVEIIWDHDGAGAAAEAMVEGYEMAHEAVLESRHTQRLAIDMKIHIPDGAIVMDAQGKPHVFHGAGDGPDSRTVAIGRTFGVIKLASDPPHWSVDGH